MILQTIFEIILVGITIYCVFNEDKFIRLEEKIKERVKRK